MVATLREFTDDLYCLVRLIRGITAECRQMAPIHEYHDKLLHLQELRSRNIFPTGETSYLALQQGRENRDDHGQRHDSDV